MATHENASIARSLNDAFNRRDYDFAASMSTADSAYVNVATGQTLTGPDGARLFLQGWATAFPDSHVETTTVIADEQGAAMEFIGRGTHSGPLATPNGDVPPTGRKVEQPFAQVLRIQGGKIVSARLYFDLVGLMQQLGIAPS